MQKRTSRIVIWLVALAAASMVLADLLPIFVQAAESRGAAPAIVQVEDGRILVAQAEQAAKPKKRKTLMDLLFGNDQPEEPAVVEKPVVRQPKAALPPVETKPEIAKSPTATRLAVFGDSLAVDVGKALERYFAEDPNLLVVTQGVGSSGLVRPDYFDWPKTIAEQISAKSFDIAVFIIGINDRQQMNVGDATFKSLTPEWQTEYSARVASIVRQLRAANTPTIWIGLPPMEAPKFGQAMIQVNEIQRLAAFGGGAEFLDIYDKFASEEGKYTARGPDLNGNPARMRKDDGIHFSAAGADKLAFYLSQSLRTYYRGGGTVGIEVADPLAGTDAQMMVRPPYQGLGQMTLLEVAGAVMSLTHSSKRAAELVSADTAEPDAEAFDMALLIDAPIGRADAFGVGRLPVVDEATAGE